MRARSRNLSATYAPPVKLRGAKRREYTQSTSGKRSDKNKRKKGPKKTKKNVNENKSQKGQKTVGRKTKLGDAAKDKNIKRETVEQDGKHGLNG